MKNSNLWKSYWTICHTYWLLEAVSWCSHFTVERIVASNRHSKQASRIAFTQVGVGMSFDHRPKNGETIHGVPAASYDGPYGLINVFLQSQLETSQLDSFHQTTTLPKTQYPQLFVVVFKSIPTKNRGRKTSRQ